METVCHSSIESVRESAILRISRGGQNWTTAIWRPGPAIDRYSQRVCLLTGVDIGPSKAGTIYPMHLPCGERAWKWLAHEIQEFAKVAQVAVEDCPERKAVGAALVLAHRWLIVAPAVPDQKTRSISETA